MRAEASICLHDCLDFIAAGELLLSQALPLNKTFAPELGAPPPRPRLSEALQDAREGDRVNALNDAMLLLRLQFYAWDDADGHWGLWSSNPRGNQSCLSIR